MRFLFIAIVACVLCSLVGFAMGYFSGLAAAKRTKQFDPSRWEKGKTPSAVD
jgi:membrane protein YqaA with SNARE-associated domain